jgi:PAS domain S-box-containing protein
MTMERTGADPERLRALLERAEHIGQLGSWEWRPDEDELLWSANLFRLFGLEPGEVRPSPDLVFGFAHPDDRERVEAEVARLGREGSLRRLDYRIVRPDVGVRHLQATIAAVERDRDGPGRIVGSVQDVTDRRRADREIAAHIAVATALGEWRSLDDGAQRLLSGLGDALGAAFAALWVPDGAGLSCRAIWHLHPHRLEPLAAVTRGEAYAPAGSLAARAWQLGMPLVATIEHGEPASDRRAAALSGRLRGATAIPALWGGAALAVVELLASEEVEPTDRLMLSLAGIGAEVGQLLAPYVDELAPR